MTSYLPPKGGSGAPTSRRLTAAARRPLSQCRPHRLVTLLATLALAVLALPVVAAPSRPELCEAAAREAAAKTGVPLSVLRAIMLTVSGRDSDAGLVPWPWTIGTEGQRVWFETADEARAYADQQLKSGRQQLGLGCFQVDYGKYGAEFASLEDMLTPRINAEFAASLLVSLQARAGGWGAASAALQGLAPDEAKTWLTTFYQYRDALRPQGIALTDQPGDAAPLDGRPRLNTYPLLLDTGAAQVMGSLVPVGPAGPGASIFAPVGGL